MITTRISIDDLFAHTFITNDVFAEVSLRWQQQEWVKYLYEHGEIVKIENHHMQAEWTTIHEMIWQLSEVNETFARLKWPEELDKIFK